MPSCRRQRQVGWGPGRSWREGGPLWSLFLGHQCGKVGPLSFRDNSGPVPVVPQLYSSWTTHAGLQLCAGFSQRTTGPLHTDQGLGPTRRGPLPASTLTTSPSTSTNPSSVSPMHTRTHTCMCIQIHAVTCAHIHTCATHTYAFTYTYTCTHIHTQSQGVPQPSSWGPLLPTEPMHLLGL